MELFAERLRLIRMQHGESRKALGEVLGVSSSQVSEMENGRKGTTLEKVLLICRHYNVSADYLLGLVDEMRPLR